MSHKEIIDEATAAFLVSSRTANSIRLFAERRLPAHDSSGGVGFGSKIEIVYVASGGQHVENLYSPLPSPPRRGGEEETHPQPLPEWRGVDSAETSKSLPDVLATDKAMALWKKAQQAGYVDEHYLPLISRTQAALLADAMAVRGYLAVARTAEEIKYLQSKMVSEAVVDSGQ